MTSIPSSAWETNAHYTTMKSWIEKCQINEWESYVHEQHISKEIMNNVWRLLIQNFIPMSDYIDIIDIVLRYGANINLIIHFKSDYLNIIEDNQVTWIMFALLTNNFAFFHMLMKHQPNLDLVDNQGWNAILYYIRFTKVDDPDILKIWIHQGANVNSSVMITEVPNEQRWHSALTLAVLRSLNKVSETLLMNGADPNFVTKPSENKAIDIAIKQNNDIIINILKKYNRTNIDLYQITNENRFTLVNDTSNPNTNYLKFNRIVNEFRLVNRRKTNNKNNDINYCNYNHRAKNKNERINMDIPINFKEVNTNINNKWSTILRIRDTPTINISLSESTISLEVKIKQLQNELEMKTKTIETWTKNCEEMKKQNWDLNGIIKMKDEKIAELSTANTALENTIGSLKLHNNIIQLSANISPRIENYLLSDYLHNKFSEEVSNESLIWTHLQKDLVDYFNYITILIDSQRQIKEKIISIIQENVNEIDNNVEVVLYGSYSTGLCLPWSDLDFVVVPKEKEYHFIDGFLNKIFMKLQNIPWWIKRQLIENTTIPWIKLKANDEYSNFNIDISLQEPKHFGIKCVELIKSYISEFELWKPLVIAFKTILKNADLNNPYWGGLSSYGLILMIVSYLQGRNSDKNYTINETTLAETFIDWLWYYGITFEFNKYQINPQPPKTSKICDSSPDTFLEVGQSHELIVVDPWNKQNNVTKTCYQFSNIKMAFMISYMSLKEDCYCGCHYLHWFENDSNKVDIEHCLLKRLFNSGKRIMENTKGNVSEI